MSGFWTDARKDLVRQYFVGEGLSAELTAQKIGGGCSRSMVCGIVFRMRQRGELTKAAAPGSPELGQRLSTQARSVNRKRKRRASGWHKQIDSEAAAAKAKKIPSPLRALYQPAAEPFAASVEELVIPLAERKTIATLVETSCRWPIGDPQHADFHFCGKTKVVGLPYCEHHARRAYQPPAPRRRAEARAQNENAPAGRPERDNSLVDA